MTPTQKNPKKKNPNLKNSPVFTMTKPGLATITLFFAYLKIDFDLSTLVHLRSVGYGSNVNTYAFPLFVLNPEKINSVRNRALLK